jgi:2,3-bisphosphoglycerate-dependent phosphoglycerate mutase
MKQNIGFYTIIFLSLTFFVFSCKEKPIQKDINGQEIVKIIGDTVFTTTGDYVVTDSIKKVYYLTRHAEKDTVPKDNPNLTEKGLLRATLLSDILRATRVDAIYSTFYTRTLYTVDSLADIKAMKILAYDPKNMRQMIDDIEANDNIKATVVVGHSNSIPSLTNTLAGKDVFTKTFDESDYDNFIIVYEKMNGNKEVLTLKYKPKG